MQWIKIRQAFFKTNNFTLIASVQFSKAQTIFRMIYTNFFDFIVAFGTWKLTNWWTMDAQQTPIGMKNKKKIGAQNENVNYYENFSKQIAREKKNILYSQMIDAQQSDQFRHPRQNIKVYRLI